LPILQAKYLHLWNIDYKFDQQLLY